MTLNTPKSSSADPWSAAGRMSPEELANARLFDNAFMIACFEHDKSAVEYVLRTIPDNPRLRVKEVFPQEPVDTGHSVRFDVLVYAEDAKGDIFCVIGVQRVCAISDGQEQLRIDLETLFNLESSQFTELLTLALCEKKTGESLPHCYVICILDEDLIGDGRPIHHMVLTSKTNPEVELNDEQIIFVNGSAQCAEEDTPLSRLMHDFRQTDPAQMHDSLLRDTVAYLKKTEDGRKEMIGTPNSRWDLHYADKRLREAVYR